MHHLHAHDQGVCTWKTIDDPILSVDCKQQDDFVRHVDPFIRKDMHKQYVDTCVVAVTCSLSFFCETLVDVMGELNIKMRKKKGVCGDCEGKKSPFECNHV